MCYIMPNKQLKHVVGFFSLKNRYFNTESILYSPNTCFLYASKSLFLHTIENFCWNFTINILGSKFPNRNVALQHMLLYTSNTLQYHDCIFALSSSCENLVKI